MALGRMARGMARALKKVKVERRKTVENVLMENIEYPYPRLWFRSA